MSELLALLLVLWCVYVSDAVWWTSENSLIMIGGRPGEFRAQFGPSMAVRQGKGFFTPPLLPPFRHAFEFRLFEKPDGRRAMDNRAAVERAIDEVLRLATPLRVLGEGLWAYLFLVTPLVVATFGLLRTWVPLLTVLGLWIGAILITFRRTWRRLYEKDPSGWRSDATLMLLSPPSAIRAADHLTRNALRGVSPVRLASVIAPGPEFCRIARFVYFGQDAASQLDAKREIERILDAEGMTAIFAAPTEREAGMKGFCPRCHEQLLRDAGECPDCVGVAIQPFDASASSTT